jgi:hypothetical protein
LSCVASRERYESAGLRTSSSMPTLEAHKIGRSKPVHGAKVP